MKNKNELVKQKTNLWGNIEKEEETLQDIMNKYKKVTEEIDELEEHLTPQLADLELRQAHYPQSVEDALILYSIESTLYYEHKLSDGYVEFDFVHQHNLYDVITYLINSNKENDFLKRGVNLRLLRDELVSSFNELGYFLCSTEAKSFLQRQRNELIDKIIFDIPGKNKSDAHPLEGHCFIDLGDELRCVYCDFTTKDYNLTKEEFEFIKLCAEKRHLVLENVTEDDLPLIKLIRQDQEKSIKPLEKEMLDEDDELTRMDREYDYFDELEQISLRLQRRIETAHNVDSGIFTNKIGEVVNDPQYISVFDGSKLMLETAKSLKRVKNLSDEAKCKEDLIKKFNVKKYEIKILSSGKTVKELYNELNSEEEKEYFIMAYGNLRNPEYREKSEYFANEREAWSYTCTTANSEINKRLLKTMEEDFNK